MEEIAPDWLNDYPEDKFTVFKTCFLSTQKNSHNLDISAEVLKRDAKTILGNFLVAKLQYGDASTHLPAEIIYGYFPKEQDVEFEETEDGNVKAWPCPCASTHAPPRRYCRTKADGPWPACCRKWQ